MTTLVFYTSVLQFIDDGTDDSIAIDLSKLPLPITMPSGADAPLPSTTLISASVQSYYTANGVTPTSVSVSGGHIVTVTFSGTLPSGQGNIQFTLNYKTQ